MKRRDMCDKIAEVIENVRPSVILLRVTEARRKRGLSRRSAPPTRIEPWTKPLPKSRKPLKTLDKLFPVTL